MKNTNYRSQMNNMFRLKNKGQLVKKNKHNNNNTQNNNRSNS